MDYFAQNMALLQANAPGLAKRLQEIEASHDNDYSPIENSFLGDNANLDHINTLAVLGFGRGVHIKELIKKTQEKTFILVIDHDLPRFKATLATQDLSLILQSKRVSLSIGEDPNYAVRFRIDSYYKVNTISDIVIAEYKPSVCKNQQYYQEVKRYLKESSVIAIQNLATLHDSSSLWQKQILENMDMIIKYPGLKSLFGKFNSMPAIIVCAGPSLDKNVEQLKYASRKAIIICVDTALKTLNKHNIKPDFVMTIDASEKNYRYYIDNADNNSYLIAGPAVYPKSLLHFAPQIFISGFGHPLFIWIEAFIGGRGAIKLGGSVSTGCFDIAQRFGANPVVFIGQDLSYNDNNCYTEGVSQERVKEVEDWLQTQEFIEVEDVYGKMIKTTRNAWTWIKWFEYQIAESPNLLCIDATEGGAKIPGTKIMTLKEVIDQYCQQEFPINQIITSVIKKEEYSTPQLLNLIEEIDVLIKDWSKVERICREGEELSKRLLNMITVKGIDKKANKIFKELGILYQRIIKHRGLIRLGAWNLEFLLYMMEKAKPSHIPETKVTSCLEFFKGVGEYCKDSVADFKKVQENYRLW